MAHNSSPPALPLGMVSLIGSHLGAPVLFLSSRSHRYVDAAATDSGLKRKVNSISRYMQITGRAALSVLLATFARSRSSSRRRTALGNSDPLRESACSQRIEPKVTFLSVANPVLRVEQATEALALSRACGWTYTLAQWKYLLASASEVFMAQRDDGRFVGCCLRTSYTGSKPEGGRGFAFLGMMLVAPASRGCGIAKELLRAFRESAEGLGQTCAMGCATDLGFPLYRKFGYTLATPNASVTKVEGSSSVAGALICETDVVVELHKDSSALSQLIALDMRATGLDRTLQLTTMMSESAKATIAIAFQEDRVVGALLSTMNRETGIITLGPILGSSSAANCLLARIAKERPDGRIAFMVNDHEEYLRTLELAGFDVSRSFHGFMLLGDTQIPGDRSQYIALLTPALG